MQINEGRVITYFKNRELLEPDAQDAATFCVQEAMEMVDCILREKAFIRNHEQKDSIGHEAAQTLMMLLKVCQIKEIDLEKEYDILMSKYGA
jgi:NTP pyrophosphatase (non-canonical NTP hydrolase)